MAKKQVKDIIKNGRKFKLITLYGLDGNISSVMEKPNYKEFDSDVLASGAHVFANPEQNHCDFFQSGVPVFKEYPEVRGSTNYGYTISGSAII